MGKLFVFLLGAAAIAYGAYRFVASSAGSTLEAHGSQVARPLENVRQKAKEIERQGQQHADEAGREPTDFAEQQRQDEAEMQQHLPDPPRGDP